MDNAIASLAPAFKLFQATNFAHVRFILPFGALNASDQPIIGPPPPFPLQGQSWFTSGLPPVPACQLPSGAPCDDFPAACPACVIGGEPDIADAAARVTNLIAAEVARGIPPHRVVLVGYSQGGALASKVVAEGAVALGGALAFVGWLPGGRAFSVPVVREMSGGIRYVLAENDTIVPPFWSEVGVEVLREAGVGVETTVVEGAGHILSQAVIADEISQFMQARVPAVVQSGAAAQAGDGCGY